MARNDGYAALMVRQETKDNFFIAKKHIEEQLGLTDAGATLTVSGALEFMCKKIMSDIISKER
jgi:hypothetical protein